MNYDHITHMRWIAFQNRLLSVGRLCFTADEAMELGGWSRPAFYAASERALRQGYLLHPRQGFYVLVPPQFISFGAPPGLQIIDDLMRFEEAPYYVGLLKAAEVLGAAHQGVMELQVVSSKRIPEISWGRGRIRMFHRTKMPHATLLRQGMTEAGYYLHSGPTLTAADLLRYPSSAGSLDAAATVVADLASQMDPGEVDALVDAVELPILQRLGYVLEHVGAPIPLVERIYGKLAGRIRKVALDTFPTASQAGSIKLDERWKVLVGKALEVDHDSEELSAPLV